MQGKFQYYVPLPSLIKAFSKNLCRIAWTQKGFLITIIMIRLITLSTMSSVLVSSLKRSETLHYILLSKDYLKEF